MSKNNLCIRNFQWGSIRHKISGRWQYLSQMKNVLFWETKTFSRVMKNTAGLYRGSVVPSAADGAPLIYFQKLITRRKILRQWTCSLKNSFGTALDDYSLTNFRRKNSSLSSEMWSNFETSIFFAQSCESSYIIRSTIFGQFDRFEIRFQWKVAVLVINSVTC